MIKVILFDLWGVLATKRMRIFDQITEAYGLPDGAHSYFVQLLEQMELGELDEAGFWTRFYTEFNIDPAIPVLPWLTIYENITVVDEAVLSLASELRKHNYKVAILSNTESIAVKHLYNLDIVSKFDIAFFSFELACLKPNEKIYKHVIQQLNVQPSEVIFIDDNLKNIRAAESLGIQGILFHDTSQVKKQLSELLKIVLTTSAMPSQAE